MKNGRAKKSSKPRILSLFSGCGGLDLGFVKEGFKTVWANDNEHWSCETYKRNFGNHVVEGDIADIDFNNTPDCDLITGGFPCQDFSMIWKRGGLETNRGNLYKHFVRAVATKRPKAFVAENVKGLLTANNGKAIKQIVKDFQNVDHAGYRIYINLFNFAEYGVPQLRQRVLILTVRSFFSGFQKFQCVEFWSLMRSHRFMGKLTADLPPRYQATEGSAIKLQHHSLSGD